MRKVLKKYFIPHKGNVYRPHFFHESTVFFTSLFIVGFLFLALGQSFVLAKTDFFSAILPKVLIDLANTDRSKNNLPQLRTSPVLEEAARKKAEHMAQYGYFGHYSPDGISPWHWFREAGYDFSKAGENLAVNFSDSAALEQAWMNSPKHKENILNAGFTEIGIATAKGMYNGAETTFVVQMFGTPRKIATGDKAIYFNDPQGVESEIKDKNELFISLPGSGDDTFLSGEDAQTFLGVARVGAQVRRMLTSPHNLLTWVYGIVAVLVALALILDLSIEIKRRHPRHALYACFLLVLLGAALYTYRIYGVDPLLVL